MTNKKAEAAKAELKINLVGVAEPDYNGNYQEHSLEQFKIYVESSERISDRRQSANSFFLSANTLLLGSEGALFKLWVEFGYAQILIGFAGVLLTLTWFALIISYRRMNSGKFEVIHELEKHLPHRLYFAEWEFLERGVVQGNYIKFTVIETLAALVILFLHIGVVVVAASILPWNF